MGRAIYKFGASDPKFQELRGNNVVMSRAIEWCAGHGMEALDFGRTETTNDGLRRFKLGWGAEETEIQYSRYDPRENQQGRSKIQNPKSIRTSQARACAAGYRSFSSAWRAGSSTVISGEL